MQGLLGLKPHFDPGSGQGTVTAGNSSQLSDGASATLLMSRQRADQLDIPYQLVFRGFQVAGCEPDEMGIGPVFAVPKLLNRCGLRLNDIDLWELNEASLSRSSIAATAWALTRKNSMSTVARSPSVIHSE
jgi:acetyl-CoA acetyltransferase